jgi:hypothetical protein
VYGVIPLEYRPVDCDSGVRGGGFLRGMGGTLLNHWALHAQQAHRAASCAPGSFAPRCPPPSRPQRPLDFSPGYISRTTIYSGGPKAGWGWLSYKGKDFKLVADGGPPLRGHSCDRS